MGRSITKIAEIAEPFVSSDESERDALVVDHSGKKGEGAPCLSLGFERSFFSRRYARQPLLDAAAQAANPDLQHERVFVLVLEVDDAARV